MTREDHYKRREDEAPPEVDTILARINVWSPSLVEMLYAIAKDQLGADERRGLQLIAKANALLGVTGLSLTVAFTYGGMLLQRAVVPRSIGWVYLSALVAGLAAAGCAIYAMLIRRSRSIGISGVFPEQLLKDADAADSPSLALPVQQGRPVESTQVGSTAYKRYLTAYYWGIYVDNSRKHRTTAGWVLAGQVLYGAFLVLLLIAGAFLWSSFNVRQPENTSAALPVVPAAISPDGGVRAAQHDGVATDESRTPAGDAGSSSLRLIAAPRPEKAIDGGQ